MVRRLLRAMLVGFLILLAFSALSACFGDQRTPVVATPDPVNPPALFISPKAVTQQKVNADFLLSYRKTTVQAYQSAGTHDAKWDTQAKAFLDAYARLSARMPNAPTILSLAELGQKTLDAGCTDPLVKSSYGMVLAAEGRDAESLVLLQAAQDGLEHGAYPRIRARMNLSMIIIIRNRTEKLSETEMKSLVDRMIKLTTETLVDKNSCSTDSRFLLSLLTADLDQPWIEKRATDVLSAIQSVKGADAYVVDVFSGILEIRLGWQARGSDWAYTVSEAGWKLLAEHLAKAREHFTRAWESHPEYPEAPCQMITVATAISDVPNENARIWFNRSIAAQFDYSSVYDNLFWALLPRWSGSHEQMYSFGIECLKTRRFDTEVPWQFFTALQKIKSDDSGNKAYWTRPDTFDRLKVLFDGYEAANNGKPSYYVLRSKRAVSYWFAGRFEESRKVIDELGVKFDQKMFRTLFSANDGYALSEVYALGGPDGNIIKHAGELTAAGKWSSALELYKKALTNAVGNPKSIPYIKPLLIDAEAHEGADQGQANKS